MKLKKNQYHQLYKVPEVGQKFISTHLEQLRKFSDKLELQRTSLTLINNRQMPKLLTMILQNLTAVA